MSSKKINPIYSLIGIVILFVVLIMLNYIFSFIRMRMDLTENKIYTLSDGSKKILGELDTPVSISLFVSSSSQAMPPFLKNFGKRVEELIIEIKNLSNGKITLEKFDPKPDSDEEDLANLNGIKPQTLPTNLNEGIYLGLAINSGDKKVTIPFISPQRERLMEYDIIRAITQISQTDKPKVTIISSLPIGGMPNPQRGMDPKWVFVEEMEKDYDVELKSPENFEVQEDSSLLILYHTGNLSKDQQYKVDQFLMKGGKLILFLDSFSLTGKLLGSKSQPMQGMNLGQGRFPSNSNAKELLKAWGYEFDASKIIADLTYPTSLMGNNRQPQEQPAVLTLTDKALNKDDIATSELSNIILLFPGFLKGKPVEGLEESILIASSTKTTENDSMLAQFSSESIASNKKTLDKSYPLALRLNGIFPSAFPDGKPKAKEEGKSDKKEERKESTHIAKSKEKTSVIIFSDSDLLFDQFCVQRANFFGMNIVQPINDNLSILQNMLEQLSGNNNLISIRSRGTILRPFTLIKEKELQAEKKFQNKLEELEKDLKETEEKLNTLQSQKSMSQKFILTKEQQDEIDKFEKKKVNVRKEIKKVRKELRKDINKLQNQITWSNILGMPIILTIIGILLFNYRRKKTAAH